MSRSRTVWVAALPEAARHLPPRCYVVLRSASDPLGGVVAVGASASWRHARRFVFDKVRGEQAPEAVHHSFPSVREGRAFWQAAGFQGDPPPLP